VALALTLNAVWNAKTTYKAYDPFEVLGVDTVIITLSNRPDIIFFRMPMIAL
jgi:hypothetical protein